MRSSEGSRYWMAALFAVMTAFALSPASGQAGTRIEDGILDSISLSANAPGRDQSVVIKPFDTAGADLGTGEEGGKEKRVEAVKTVQEEGPKILADAFVAKLSSLGAFKKVSGSGSAGIVVSGRFTIIDPGSRAKRYFAGFGAGKGRLEVEGTVKDSSGQLLATFRQKRLTVMGVAGGDYEKKLRSDCERLGEDIAEFLDAWARGKKLR